MESGGKELAAIILGALIGLLGNFFVSSLLLYFNYHPREDWALIISFVSGACFFFVVGIGIWLLSSKPMKGV